MSLQVQCKCLNPYLHVKIDGTVVLTKAKMANSMCGVAKGDNLFLFVFNS